MQKDRQTDRQIINKSQCAVANRNERGRHRRLASVFCFAGSRLHFFHCFIIAFFSRPGISIFH